MTYYHTPLDKAIATAKVIIDDNRLELLPYLLDDLLEIKKQHDEVIRMIQRGERPWAIL
jgi:hypothetical protein